MENLNSVDLNYVKKYLHGKIFIVSKVYDDASEQDIFATEREELAKFFCDTSNLVREAINYRFQYRPFDLFN